MARAYSANTFLRCTPNGLLKQYFDARGLDLGFDWTLLHETEVNPLFVALEQLPVANRSRVDADFRQINELASTGGVLAISDQARLEGLELAEQIAGLPNHYGRAVWTFLNHPQLFRTAGRFHELERLGGWRRRLVGKRLAVQTDVDSRATVGKHLRMFYRRQGRGRHCHVDYYLRPDPLRHCFFAYPEDFATLDLSYDEQGRFRHSPRRSAFEIICAYRPEEGTLETRAAGGRAVVAQIETIFATTVLGLADLPDDDGRAPYDLTVLSDPGFDFPLDPSIGVSGVELRAVRFDLPLDPVTGAGRRISLSVCTRQSASDALQRLRAEALDPGLCAADLFPSQAKMRMTFPPHNGDGPKSLTFEITYPDRCTLKDDPYDQLARRCLRAWGIARD